MPLVSLEFNGGSLNQFIAAVKASSRQPINVVCPAEAAKLEVPALSLRNVTALVALQSLEYAARPGPNQSIRVTLINMGRTGMPVADGEAPTFAIAVQGFAPQPGPVTGLPFAAAAPVTRVYSVRELLPVDGDSPLPGFTIDQVVQPVQTALLVDLGDAQGDEPKIMVHKESNLIIIRGSQRQTELARQVIDRLRDDVEALRDRGRADREFRSALQEITAQRKAELNAAERLMRTAQEQRDAAVRQLEIAQKEKPDERPLLASLQKRADDCERNLTLTSQSLDRIRAQAGDEEVAARRLAAERTRINAEAQYLRQQIDDLRRQIEDIKAGKPAGAR